MFTGLIEELGRVVASRPGAAGGRVLVLQANFARDGGVKLGDSIATNGVCLTATRIEGDTFSVDAGPETLERTTIGRLSVGAPVNLERSATLATRLGGHLVQGHVDAVGRVRSVAQRENAWDLWIEAPEELLRLAVPRGSIAVDGISLTITGRENGAFSISIIPHTWAVTSIRGAAAGTLVNLEADLIARYVAGLLEPAAAAPKPGLTEAFLKEHGFT
ncbi:MAG: riboflavin synthase [Deltaproteobacteria bacterium]|nr:riboflavin synthase [Deltaproteobacteria bacterium]